MNYDVTLPSTVTETEREITRLQCVMSVLHFHKRSLQRKSAPKQLTISEKDLNENISNLLK